MEAVLLPNRYLKNETFTLRQDPLQSACLNQTLVLATWIASLQPFATTVNVVPSIVETVTAHAGTA